MGNSYIELLKDPRWQKKRLKVFERAGFKCEHCGEETKTLNVHHQSYLKGLKPWEYDDSSLHCFCERCHKYHQEMYERIRVKLNQINISDFEFVYGYLCGLEMLEYPNVSSYIDSYEQVEGVVHAWSLKSKFLLNPEDVIEKIKDLRINGWTIDKVAKRKSKKGRGK